MKLRKELFAVFYVIILLLNDRQVTFAKDLNEIGQQSVSETYVAAWRPSAAGALSDEGVSRIRLIYELNGGRNSAQNPRYLTSEQLPVQLQIPMREGYNFAGWYTDSSYRNKITQIDGDAQDVVLFAKWTEAIDNYYNVEMYSYQSAHSIDYTGRTLKDCSYAFLDQIRIPGMPSTREEDCLTNVIRSDRQCLQGLCFTPDYILMTSYAEGDGDPGSLLVFDRESGTHLVTLDMKEKSHLGGIAFDGENVWICHSDTNTLERIPYEWVRAIAEEAPGCCVDASALSEEYRVQNVPSCITCYGGRIWVATHTKFFDSKMVSYRYSDLEERLIPMSSYRIPNKVQGIAFDEGGAVYMSTSYGRNNSSYLKVYSSLLALDDCPDEPAGRVEMPPCSEEIAIVGDRLYVVFESASRKYFEGTDGKGTSSSPIDQILELSVSSVW